MRRGLAWIPIALVVALPLGATASAEIHESTGQVVRVDPAERTVELVESGVHLKLTMGEGTRLLDEHNHRLKGLKALRVGDYVREECTVQKDGRSIAQRIRVLRPAWRLLEGPEQ